ncbi:unnamed protein product [Ixodes pacificus]
MNGCMSASLLNVTPKYHFHEELQSSSIEACCGTARTAIVTENETPTVGLSMKFSRTVESNQWWQSVHRKTFHPQIVSSTNPQISFFFCNKPHQTVAAKQRVRVGQVGQHFCNEPSSVIFI